MKKIKILIGIVTFIILVAGILFLFNHAEKLMPTYEGKIMEYENKYFENDEKSNSMEFMEIIERSTLKRTLTEEEKNILKIESIEDLKDKKPAQYDAVSGENYLGMTGIENNDTAFIEQYVVPETKYGDIICQVKKQYIPNREYDTLYTLLFTKDLQNIYYYEITTTDIAEENIEVNKEELVKQLQLAIQKLKIPVTKFEPTILKIDEQKYLLKDEKENLQITYDVINKQIKEIKFNF